MPGRTSDSLTPLALSTSLTDRPVVYVGTNANDHDRLAARAELRLAKGEPITLTLDNAAAMRRLAIDLLEAAEQIREWDEVYGPHAQAAAR